MPVVGQTTLQPGQETTLSVQFTMHRGMGGPHKFAVKLQSDDPVQPAQTLTVAAIYPRP